jgi:hypothetical protein
MNVLAKSLLWLSVLIIGLSLVVLLLPQLFISVNQSLSNVSNIMSFLSMLFAAFALLVASIAYKSSILRPKLKLIIIPWMAEGEGVSLAIESNTKKVPITRPLTSWRIWIVNTGNAVARYPIVDIKFHGMYFAENSFPLWNATHHEHAFGWYGFQWSPEDKMIVHPHFPIELPTMYLSNQYLGGDKLEIEVTMVADGFNAQVERIPVKLVYQ